MRQWLLIPLCCAAAACGSGCFGAVTYDRVGVVVIDGDTGRAVPHADVYTPHGQWGAKPDSAVADAAGRATLREARYLGGGIEAAPDGYLRSATGSADRTGAEEVTVYVYRPPNPLAGLVIPTGFRGLLQVRPERVDGRTAQPEPPPPGPPWLGGRREFLVVADVDGVTAVLPPPKLARSQAGATMYLARFDDGTPLRYENPTARAGWSGEHVYGLPDVRDLVPPHDDGVALFHLGSRFDFRPPTTREAIYRHTMGEGYGIYLVGTRDEAAAEQQRLLGGALPHPRRGAKVAGYSFRPEPLDIDLVEVGTQLSPLFVPNG